MVGSAIYTLMVHYLGIAFTDVSYTDSGVSTVTINGENVALVNNTFSKTFNLSINATNTFTISATDNANNKVTYTLILKIDRTAPPVPTLSMYRESLRQ